MVVLDDANDLLKKRNFVKAIEHVASSGNKSDFDKLDIRDERTAEDDNLMCSEENLEDSNMKICPLSVLNKATLSTENFDIDIVPEKNNLISVDTVVVSINESLTRDSPKKSESLCMFKANISPKTFLCHSEIEPEIISVLGTLHTPNSSKLEPLDVENITSCHEKEGSTNQKANRPTRKVEAEVSKIVQETCTQKNVEHPIKYDSWQNSLTNDVGRITMPHFCTRARPHLWMRLCKKLYN